MGLLLEDIKSLLISRRPVVDADLGAFLKDLDDDYSSNLSGRWIGELPKFEPEVGCFV